MEPDKKAHLEIARLCRTLARDCMRISKREAKYSKQALGEKRFSKKDLELAKKHGLIGSMCDDEHEVQICETFAQYRRSVSEIFRKRANDYLRLARKHEKLAKAGGRKRR